MYILNKQLFHLKVTSAAKGGLPINDYRVKRRVLVFGTFQVLVLSFLAITLALFSWDVVRYWKISTMEATIVKDDKSDFPISENINCQKIFESDFVNDFMVALSQYCATQAEMLIVLILFWKPFTPRSPRTNPSCIDGIVKFFRGSNGISSARTEGQDGNLFQFKKEQIAEEKSNNTDQ